MKPADGNRPPEYSNLLEFDLSASCFELCLDLLSFVLGSAFLDSLRSCFNEVLSFLEAETGDCLLYTSDAADE